MSSQLVRIGMTCTAIVLVAAFAGSQLSTGGNFANLIPKEAEEDEAGAVESADSDDAKTGGDAEDETADADENSADEDEADEEVAEEDSAEDDSEEDVASDESEDGDAAEGEQLAEGEGASEGEDAAEQDDSGEGDGASADGGSPAGIEGGERLSDDNGFALIGGNR